MAKPPRQSTLHPPLFAKAGTKLLEGSGVRHPPPPPPFLRRGAIAPRRPRGFWLKSPTASIFASERRRGRALKSQKCLPQGVFGQKGSKMTLKPPKKEPQSGFFGQKWAKNGLKTPKKGHFWGFLAKNWALLAGKYPLKSAPTQKPRLSTTFGNLPKKGKNPKVVERRGFWRAAGFAHFCANPARGFWPKMGPKMRGPQSPPPFLAKNGAKKGLK